MHAIEYLLRSFFMKKCPVMSESESFGIGFYLGLKTIKRKKENDKSEREQLVPTHSSCVAIALI